jgi:hypothetical protein
MLESKREREQAAAFACMKSNDIRDDEMLSRIQEQLESALQQVHEDYRLLSQGLSSNINLILYKDVTHRSDNYNSE